MIHALVVWLSETDWNRIDLLSCECLAQNSSWNGGCAYDFCYVPIFRLNLIQHDFVS